MFSNSYQIKILISKTIDVDILDVILGNYKVPETKKSILEQRISMLEAGYPLDYVIGEVNILDLKLSLNSHTLIPREETEDWLLRFQSECIGSQKPYQLVDVGTGTGIIGIFLSRFYQRTLLVDICCDALDIAKANSVTNKCKNIELLQSDGLSKVGEFLLKRHVSNWHLVANLPYLPLSDKVFAKQTKVDKEPDIALYSGCDGLELFGKIVDQLESISSKPSVMVFELDPRNIIEASKIIQNLGYNVRIWKDYNGNNRVLLGFLDQIEYLD